MHVFASLAGFGSRIVPRAPFRLTSEPGNPRHVNVHWTREDGTVVTARVFADEGGCRLEPTDGPADLMPLPDATDAWRIATSAFSIAWPSEIVVQSSPTPETPPGFDLVAPGDVLLWPQGLFLPARVADPTRLAGPGQRLVRSGQRGAITFVELAYEHGGGQWHQRHDLVPLGGQALVLTVQAPASRWAWASQLADEVADSARAE